VDIEKTLETIIGNIKETARVEAVFGKPEVIGEKTIIPIAQVGYGFGFGFGEGTGPTVDEGEQAPGGKGGGGGGGVSARPIAVLEVTPEYTRVTEVADATRIVMCGIALGGWSVFWIARTLRHLLAPRK
jgi:uncharacterized spore protein YtfJ